MIDEVADEFADEVAAFEAAEEKARKQIVFLLDGFRRPDSPPLRPWIPPPDQRRRRQSKGGFTTTWLRGPGGGPGEVRN